MKLDWCDIDELIYSVVQKLPPVYRDHKIDVHKEENLPLFKLDTELMKQVLQNILLNAVQYTPLDSQITIDVSIKENNCVIIISDNGKGFPESEIQFVFDKFYRLPNSKAGGTGLGLSIAKGFTEAHKGNLKVENIAAGGAKFTISIPAETSYINNLKNE